MAVTYLSPGVYVEEVDKGTKPIEVAGASMAAFIGITAEASIKAINPETGERYAVESRLNKATLVTNWTQYTNIFGDFVSGAYLPDAVYGYFANGGGPCYVTSVRATLKGIPVRPLLKFLSLLRKAKASKSRPKPLALVATISPLSSPRKRTKKANQRALSPC
jgi:hypothetical protein